MFAALMRWMKAQKLLPVISETEREALEAGDVWLEGQFFSGSFDAQALLQAPYLRLTEGLFKPRDGSVGLGRLLKAFRLQAEVAELHELLKVAQRRGDLPKGEPEAHLQDAARQGLLSREQSQAVSEAL